MSTTSSPSEPVRRTAKNEKHDQEQRVKNILDGVFEDWPNDAGFDGLTEQRGPISVPVTGTIPTWAAGTLYRTGPGASSIELPKGTLHLTHWFDGLAHTHRFDIVRDDDGKACKLFYSSRRQSDALVKEIQRNGKVGMSFGQRLDPCVSVFSKMMGTFHSARSAMSSNRANENVGVTVLGNVPGAAAAAVKISNESDPPVANVKTPATASGHRTDGIPPFVWLGTDTTTMKQIDPRTMEPIGFATQGMLHPELKGPLSCAHAERDPVTGDFFNFNLQFGHTPTYHVFRISAATGKTEIIATVAGRADVQPAYIHSFYLTSSFAILCVPSTHLGMHGMKVLWERNLADAIVPFDEKNKCKWFVVDRLHGKGVVAEFETDAGFFFHTVNAFEEDTPGKEGLVTVSCDVIDFANTDIIFGLEYDIMRVPNGRGKEWINPARAAGSAARLTRHQFTFARPGPNTSMNRYEKLSGDAVTTAFQIPSPHAGELPTINRRFATKRYRYVYSLTNRGCSTLLDAIVKTDTETRDAIIWEPPRGHTPGEAIFVERPGAVDEDDGVLLSVILDGYARKSYLLCLDARTMKEVGRGEMKFAVGLGFHGMHTKI